MERVEAAIKKQNKAVVVAFQFQKMNICRESGQIWSLMLLMICVKEAVSKAEVRVKTGRDC